MFVFFDPDSLRVDHVVMMAPPNYRDFLADAPDQHWAETDETMTMEEIEVMPDRTVRRRVPMQLAVRSGKVNEPATIAGVPEGCSIKFNDKPMGVMDASGVLEFTPSTGGTYRLRFEASGYITKEIVIEVGT